MILPTCTQCGKIYPTEETPYLCSCGGIFDYSIFPDYFPPEKDPNRKDLFHYRKSFGLGDDLPIISLGEGNTPLLEADYHGYPIWLKLEYFNPSGSYKDRGSAVLTSFLVSRGIKKAVEDSSGNAGASFAAYAARAGIDATIFIPESASGPKRNQIEAYGAEVKLIAGPRSEAAKAVKMAAEAGHTYASHAFMPFGLLGIATISYEINEQFGNNAPGTLVAPLGHGGLLYGVMQGYKSLKKAGLINKEPYYVGVQSGGCSPVFDAFLRQEITLREPVESDTIAEGVRVSRPVRGPAILKEIGDGSGRIMVVGDDQLRKAYSELAKKGFFVEPTSALVWAALENIIGKIPEPIVLILTGSGLKTQISV